MSEISHIAYAIARLPTRFLPRTIRRAPRRRLVSTLETGVSPYVYSAINTLRFIVCGVDDASIRWRQDLATTPSKYSLGEMLLIDG